MTRDVDDDVSVFILYLSTKILGSLFVYRFFFFVLNKRIDRRRYRSLYDFLSLLSFLTTTKLTSLEYESLSLSDWLLFLLFVKTAASVIRKGNHYGRNQKELNVKKRI